MSDRAALRGWVFFGTCALALSSGLRAQVSCCDPANGPQRVASEEQHLLAGITVRQANFTFDAVGNRITAVIDGAAETTSFNANDELTQQA